MGQKNNSGRALRGKKIKKKKKERKKIIVLVIIEKPNIAFLILIIT